MNKLLILSTIGLAGLGLSSPAFAFVFTPAATSFAGGGPFTVVDASGNTLNCSARYKLKTNNSGTKLKFLSVLFFGSSACSAMTAQNLNWIGMKTPNNTTVKIMGMQLSTPNCGPNNVPNGNLSGSTLTYNNVALNLCTLTFSIAISPIIN